MDKMNRVILEHLKANGRMSWQNIGKHVHLTGQAVSARVAQLQEQGVISGFTIRQDHLPRHFVTVFMEHNDFAGFERFLKKHDAVASAYKITGDGCYQLELIPDDGLNLEHFLNEVLRWGRYKVQSSMRCVK